MKVRPCCQACGQRLDVEYRIRFNKALGRFLAHLFEAGGRPVEIPSLQLSNALYSFAAKIARWGLAEPYITPENEHKRGWWRITPKGVDFISGKITIQEYAVTKSNLLLRFEGRDISFTDASPGYQVRGDYVAQIRRQMFNVGEDGQFTFPEE